MTYKNTNIGFEVAVAQSFEKPVIITRYMPKTVEVTGKDKATLKRLRKKGAIQYSKMPIEVPADITSVYRVDYKNESELKRKLKEGFSPK